MQHIFFDGYGYVFVSLPDGSTRRIGQFSCDGKTFSCKRVKKHVFRITKSLGFNYELLRDCNFENFVVYFGKKTLFAKRQDILDRGMFLEFRGNGFEKQIFYPLTAFEALW